MRPSDLIRRIKKRIYTVMYTGLPDFDAWAIDLSCEIDQYYSNGGDLYLCLVSHIADVDNEPLGVDTSLWRKEYNEAAQWPDELKDALMMYSQRVGVFKTALINEDEVIDSKFVKPNDCLKAIGIRDKTSRNVKFVDDESGSLTLSIPSDDIYEVVYPFEMPYFIDLTTFISNDDHLPKNVEVSLLYDYLVSHIGATNAEQIEALGSFELDFRAKSKEEYQSDKQIVEERIDKQRMPIPVFLTW